MRIHISLVKASLKEVELNKYVLYNEVWAYKELRQDDYQSVGQIVVGICAIADGHGTGLWTELSECQVLAGSIFHVVQKPGDSSCWFDFLKIRQYFYPGVRFGIEDR